MMRRSTLVFLGTTISILGLVAGTASTGCQSNGGSGGSGTGNTGNTATGTGTGTGGSGNSGTGTTDTGTGTGNTGTTGSTTTSVSTLDTTITDITTGKAGITAQHVPMYKLTGVVATSHKFLVSGPGSSGSCLWGVFISEPGITTAAANSGIIALSYGDQATIPDGGTKAYCPVPGKTGPAGDAFPDDVKPGDVFDLIGEVAKYAPSGCTTGAVQSYQFANITSATRTGTAAVPAPAPIDAAGLTTLAAGTDAAFFAKWNGVKVRATNQTPVVGQTDAGAPTIVGQYGVITLSGSNAKVSDKVYYNALLNSLKDPCHEGPIYADTTVTFSQLDGFVFLDYCTWSLAPENRCVDFTPPSDDCAGSTCQ